MANFLIVTFALCFYWLHTTDEHTYIQKIRSWNIVPPKQEANKIKVACSPKGLPQSLLERVQMPSTG